MATHKAHLGVGWAFPPKVVNGGLRYALYEDDIEQAIQIILLTSRGERVMLPEFGAGLRDFVFEPNTDATRARLEESVRKALVDWEPRLNLERVEVTEGDAPNLVLIHVDYVVRATNSFYNRVYPFYLLEGRA
ncbi:MAG: GPW/gp25 family protein [Vicinamibacterales bacterium]